MEQPARHRQNIRGRKTLLLLIWIATFAIAEVTYHAGALAGLERVYSDLWHRISGVRYAPRHTALVVVDEASLAKFPDDPLVFWPPLFARAITTLQQAGAQIIGIDFLPSVTPEEWIGKLDLPKTDALQNYDLAFRQALNAGKTVLVGAVVRGEKGETDELLLPHRDYLLSLPGMDLAAAIGYANLETDSDGAIRRFTVVPSLNLPKGAASGAPRFAFAPLLSLRAAAQSLSASDWTLSGQPYSPNVIYPVSYAGPPGTIPRISFYHLLEKDALQNPAIKALKGKTVIIGGDYQGMNDVHSTPYSTGLLGRNGAFMAGPEIQANIAETMLSGNVTIDAPGWMRWSLYALLLLAALIAAQRLTPWTGAAATLAIAAAALGVGYVAFRGFLLFPAAHLQLGLVAGFFMMVGIRLTREEREKSRVKSMFEGYVSDDVVNMLIDSGKKLDVGGQSMQITVLFSDIRNFTTITEKLSAHETVEFLNAYFERVIDVIRNEGGRIDKFIGDAVMAEFGVPYPFPDHARRALRAARNMRIVAEDFKNWMREKFPGRDLPEFSIGIGLHSGDAIVGNLGSRKRMEFTAIGDTVNVASRLEGETKTFNCVIVASADTVAMAGAGITTGRHENLLVKGREKPVDVYEILDVQD